MLHREKELFNNETLLVSLFLNPYVNSILDDKQRQIAIDHLLKLWSRINKIDRRDKEINQ